jgi:hypothetical protein
MKQIPGRYCQVTGGFLVGRTFHISLVIAIATLTVLSTGTVLRNANAHFFSALLQQTGNTASNASNAHESATIPSAIAKTVSSIPSQQADVPATGLVTGWSSQDITKLVGIATHLYASLSPGDLTTLGRELGKTSSDATQNASTDSDVVRILESHLPEDDVSWIQSHFTGQQAFSPQDVQLLQKTVAELENDLTPEEQQLVTQEMSGWVSSQLNKG